MLQLYYNPGSPPSRAVLQVIRILGLEVEVKTIDLLKTRENLSPEFLKINPMHQVPALVDGDFVLTESRAIMTYLVNSRKPGHELYPTDPKVRALIDQRLYFDAINVFELAASIVRPVFFLGSAVATDKVEKLRFTLKVLESFLENNLYFAGSHPTLADVSILSDYSMILSTFTNIGEHPKLNEWFKRCQSLTGYEEMAAGGQGFKAFVAAKGLSLIPLN